MEPSSQPALYTRDLQRCTACRSPASLPDFTMAFQPIVDLECATVHAYEALVRPMGGGSAAR